MWWWVLSPLSRNEPEGLNWSQVFIGQIIEHYLFIMPYRLKLKAH